MYSVKFFVFFVLFLFSLEACPNNCIDSSHGICSQDTCMCLPYHSGSDCSVTWHDISGWLALLYVYCTIDAAAHICWIGWGLWQLWLSYKYSRHRESRKFWSFSTTTLGFLILGCIFRVVYDLLDPASQRGIFNPFSDAIVFNLAIILWLLAGCFILMYWLEITTFTGIRELSSISNTRPAFIVFALATGIIILPLGVTGSLGGPVLLAYDLTIGVILVAFMIVSSILGTRVIRTLNEVSEVARTVHFSDYLRKVTFSLLFMNCVLFLIVVILALFPVVGNDPWVYHGFNISLRILELLVVAIMLQLLSKKVPPQYPSDPIASDSSTP